MANSFGSFTVKSRDEIRDDILRVLRNGLINRGVSNPNVSPKSDEFGRAEGFSNELVVVESNAVVQSNDLMPDTATDTGLDNWLAAVNLTRRPAAGSVGVIRFNTSAASLVALGSQLLDGSGLRYQVTVGGTYSPDDLIPVEAIDVGVATNHDEGDTLKWVGVAPAFSAPTALVGPGGLIDGVDAEDDETARARLLDRLGNPPGAGNWQQIAEFGEAADPRVQKTFVYPAAQGPATVHVAVAGYSTATSSTVSARSANRDIASVVMTGTVVPYITGLVAEHAAITVTTVANVATNVAMGLSLPAATTAAPPGPGGGWLDGTPWPVVDGATWFNATVDYSVHPPAGGTTTTVFTVNAKTAPTAGVSHICWVNPTTWTLYRARVVSFTTPASNYFTVTVDTPMIGIDTAGGTQYVFPDAVNMQAYVTALLNAFAKMGPGEKSSNPTVLVRGFRHPVPQLSWPYSLDATQLRAVEDAGNEVLAASWVFRSTTTPAIPGVITSPPNILVPGAVGFYAQP